MPYTVKDMIKSLQSLPPDMEVWVTWDESGEYWPASKPQCRIDHVEQVNRLGRVRWEMSYPEPGKGSKSVCILQSV